MNTAFLMCFWNERRWGEEVPWTHQGSVIPGSLLLHQCHMTEELLTVTWIIISITQRLLAQLTRYWYFPHISLRFSHILTFDIAIKMKDEKCYWSKGEDEPNHQNVSFLPLATAPFTITCWRCSDEPGRDGLFGIREATCPWASIVFFFCFFHDALTLKLPILLRRYNDLPWCHQVAFLDPWLTSYSIYLSSFTAGCDSWPS